MLPMLVLPSLKRLVVASESTTRVCRVYKSFYASSLLLPNTSFVVHLAGWKRVEKDRAVISSGSFRSVYRRQLQRPDTEHKTWLLHDGPPYANGDAHLGHAVNKILKDVTNRWKIINGYRVHYRPGWDCHGLPIEQRVLKKYGTDLDPLDIRKRARSFALAAVKAQKDEFLSWGIMGDFENPYLTMSPELIKNEFKIFLKLVKDGKVFRSHMPVYWSPSSRSALAESELVYKSNYVSTAAYVAFKLDEESVSRMNINNNSPISLLIWTTTPWSLAANQAICVSEEGEYSLISSNAVHGGQETFVVATKLLEGPELKEIFGDYTRHGSLMGKDLVGLKYANPLSPQDDVCRPVLPSDHVTMDAGTGLVHTAPAHGQEDFLVGIKHGLDLTCPVNELGEYIDCESVPSSLTGLPVLTAGSKKVLSLLGDRLILSRPYEHSYPCDWRTYQPVILRACPQWFLKVSQAQEDAKKLLSTVEIAPTSFRKGFLNVLEKRPYWCLSRQRAWGTPIPVFYDSATHEPIITEEIVNRCCQLIDAEGPDFWWRLSNKEILDGTSVDPSSVVRGKDILDVWFDSGITWNSVLLKAADDEPVDLYLEGIDQFSGWFYSSLLTRLALQGKVPYKKIFVHGFALDKDGKKMSKSLGNVIHPKSITRGEGSEKKGKENKKKLLPVYGVDALRYWAATHGSQGSPRPNYVTAKPLLLAGLFLQASNVLAGDKIFIQVKEDLNRMRNTFRFALGNLATLKDAKELISIKHLRPLDTYALHLAHAYLKNVEDSYDCMDYSRVIWRLKAFIAQDVSAFYFHLLKDRLYCDTIDSRRRQSAVTAIFHLTRLLRATLAPIAPILGGEVSEACPILGDTYEDGNSLARLKESFQELAVSSSDLELVFLHLRENIRNAMDGVDSLQDKELLLAPLSERAARILSLMDEYDLREALQVPVVTVSNDIERGQTGTHEDSDFAFQITDTARHLCPRCKLKVAEQENCLCGRCQAAVDKLEG